MDSCYADDLDAIVAQLAGVSKYHFIQLQRGVRLKPRAVPRAPPHRALHLLRATNLTVTEVCILAGHNEPRVVQYEVPLALVGERRRRSSNAMAVGVSRIFPAATFSCAACKRTLLGSTRRVLVLAFEP